MHTFDIKKSAASLATWREHEAYTSKALRKSPLKSPSSSDPSALSAAAERASMPPPAPQSQPDLPVSLEDAIKGALQGLETHVGAFAGFLQDTSSALRTAAENTREVDASAIEGIFNGFKGIFTEVGKVGKAMVEAFDAEAFAHSPSVSQRAVEDPTISMPATEGRVVEGSRNSNVAPVTRHNNNVQASSATLAKTDFTKPAASSYVSLAPYRPLGKIWSLAPEIHPKEAATWLASGSAIQTAAHAETSNTEQDAPRRLYFTSPNRHNEVDGSSSADAKSPEPASCAEAPATEVPDAPFASYASLKDPWKTSSEPSSGRYVDCSHCQRTKVCAIPLRAVQTSTFLLTHPAQSYCKKGFSGGACVPCIREVRSCSLVTGAIPGASVTTSTVPPPGVRYDQTYEARESNTDDVTSQGRRPPQWLNARQNDQVQLPRETAKTYTQPAKATTSRSILDLENSDPDFSTRYPPLMSLRKSKTISSLADRSKSPFLANINPEAAISRFPSLSQIEDEARSDQRLESLVESLDGPTKRWSFVKDSQDLQQPATRPRLVIPGRPAADVAPAAPPKLPGAWPEPRLEADGPTLPTSEESSGAFFDRMTRSRSPEPATRSFRYIPAHLRHSRTSASQHPPPHLREPLNMPATYGPRHLRHAMSIDTMAHQLGRSKTVTASNPAARLTRPFDPLEAARQSRDTSEIPRRSDSERHRRRPYNDSFTGAGRTPWESFERSPQAERPVADRHEARPTRREARPFNAVDQSSTGADFGISDKVGDCVRQLRDMGYGHRSPHEASRLSIYAAACDGNVVDAVEMIEEDRKAGRHHKNTGDKLGVRPFNHNERPSFGH